MTAALGVFAITVCLLLPGLLIMQLVRPKVLTFGAVALAGGLSLTVNHLLVSVLVLLNLYQQWIVISCCLLMFLALVAYCRLPSEGPLSIRMSVNKSYLWTDIVYFVVIATAICFFAFKYAAFVWPDFGEVFTGIDVVVSWNRWAVDWAHSEFPRQTWLYPQLLPTLYSLTYIIIGTTDPNGTRDHFRKNIA